MKKLLPLALLLLSSPAFATTWYVDTVNGGPRYSVNYSTLASCNGKSLTPFNPAGAPNQACPYQDEIDLWNDQTYGTSAWIIAGGDIVEFHHVDSTHPARAGGTPPGTAIHCTGIGDDCTSPPVPSGTLANPTTFRGENYASCSVAGAHGILHPDPSKTSYLWAGGQDGVGQLFDVSTTQHVKFQCLDMTDHAACNRITISCTGLDWAGKAITSGAIVPAVNDDVTLESVNIHGFQSRGIIGNLGGTWILNATDIKFNGSAGWDLDPGGGQDSHNGIIEMHDGAIDWTGCTEEYPVVDAIPAQPNGCTDSNNGGYGDGVGSAGVNGIISAWFDHVEANYNTQDAIDLGHFLSGTIKFTRNYAEGNMAGTFKSGNPAFDYMYSNFSNGNCQRMSAALTGAPSGYNNGLTGFCRAAGDILSINWDPALSHTLTADWQFNTFIGYGATMVDPQCATAGVPQTCTGVTWIYSNNVMLGYINPSYNSGLAPGWGNSMSPTTQAKNLWYGLRFCNANGSDLSPTCATSPNFTSQPASPMSAESNLDNFNFYPATGSAVIHAGTYSSSAATDFYSVTRPNPPTVGAAEPSGTPTASAPTYSPVAGTYASTQSVTISSTTAGATICYTSDGSTPTANGSGTCTHGTTYSTAVSVASSLTLKAVASKSGYLDSSASSAAYTITPPVVPSGSVTGKGTISGTAVFP